MANQGDQIIEATCLGEFFRDQIILACTQLNIEVTDLVQFYMVNLLCDYSRCDQVNEPGKEPLALQYKRALEASASERLRILKEMGDVSLYVSGFFEDSIEKSLVDIDYYIAMGGGAYENLASRIVNQPNGDTFAELYGQLSQNFPSLVDVLNEVSSQCSGLQTNNSQEILRLYDRWVRTGSTRARQKLFSQGLVPIEKLLADYIQ